MGKKLYVGNLVYSVTRSDLESWFAEYGTVQSAQVITDRDTGRSKGFGFVEMDSDDQAQAAIQGLNEKEHEGRRLTVNEAKPRVAQTNRGGGYGGGSEGGGRRIDRPGNLQGRGAARSSTPISPVPQRNAALTRNEPRYLPRFQPIAQ